MPFFCSPVSRLFRTTAAAHFPFIGWIGEKAAFDAETKQTRFPFASIQKSNSEPHLFGGGGDGMPENAVENEIGIKNQQKVPF